MPPNDGIAFLPAATLENAAIDEAKVRERIQHVVVLMLENRSFDHMLGFLQHPHPDDYGQADLAMRYNADAKGKYFAKPGAGPNKVDPDHSHHGILQQMGPADGVARSAGSSSRSSRSVTP